jgi:hypothetical protein
VCGAGRQQEEEGADEVPVHGGPHA